jgi:hypothetical protein
MPRVGDLTPSYYHQGRQAPPPLLAVRVRRHLPLAATAKRANHACGNPHSSLLSRSSRLVSAAARSPPEVRDASQDLQTLSGGDNVILRFASNGPRITGELNFQNARRAGRFFFRDCLCRESVRLSRVYLLACLSAYLLIVACLNA